MGRRKGGYRRKTRKLMTKKVRTHGKISLRRILAEFKEGDRVALVAEPGVQKGLFHLRFQGKAGKVIGKQGRSFIVNIKDGGKPKIIITPAVHLKRLK